jgi:hypothetical protein
MRSRIVSTITSDVDLETFTPKHSVDIEAEDELPEEVVAAAVYGACQSTMKGLVERYPRLFRDTQDPAVKRVLAVCDEWDKFSKGESPSSQQIRAAVDG